jgi:hypothetical protein
MHCILSQNCSLLSPLSSRFSLSSEFSSDWSYLTCLCHQSFARAASLCPVCSSLLMAWFLALLAKFLAQGKVVASRLQLTYFLVSCDIRVRVQNWLEPCAGRTDKVFDWLKKKIQTEVSTWNKEKPLELLKITEKHMLARNIFPWETSSV